jgi:quaternary ammonium compound-resistance protein SugE
MWWALILAGLGEVAWIFFMKKSQGFSNLNFTMLFVISLVASMALLGLAVRQIPVSVAYPVWTGIGAVGSVVLGVMLFSEPLGLLKGLCVLLILMGIIGLKATS